MAGRKNVLSELQAQKIRENYKPGDSITKIAEKYRVHYKTIKNILGDLYMPSKAAQNSLKQRLNKVKEETNQYKKMMFATSLKEKAERYFNKIKVGDYINILKKEDGYNRTIRYNKVSGTVTQKTDNLIFVGRESISKGDLIEYLATKERVAV